MAFALSEDIKAKISGIVKWVQIQSGTSSFTEDEFVFEQIIRSCHIDMSRHMNNIEYIRLALCVFDDDFLQSHEITDLEVHYTGESRERQLLRVFRRNDAVTQGKTLLVIAHRMSTIKNADAVYKVENGLLYSA